MRSVPRQLSRSPTVLRQQRTALTSTQNRVSYAIEVLTVDLEALNRHTRSDHDHLQAIIASGWDNGGWSFSVDTSGLIAAAADADGLLDLHHELVSSDLDDPDVARSLLARMKVQRGALIKRKNRLDREIKQTQEILLRQYVTGIASVDDWLA